MTPFSKPLAVSRISAYNLRFRSQPMAQVLHEPSPPARRSHVAAPAGRRRRHKQPANKGSRWLYWLLASLFLAVPITLFGALLGLSGISSRAARIDLGLLDST